MSEGSDIWGKLRRLQRCNDGSEKLTTTPEALAEENEPEVLMMTMDASSE